MKILSIDTSSKICTVAVLEDYKLLKEISKNSGLTHSETLMPIIKDIFSDLDLTLNDIDLIVCDKGPGSFTGIRIGIATAKGFQDSLNINTIGISSLEALAYNCAENGIICSMIDAKNSNAYYAIFEKISDTYILKNSFSVDTIENILSSLLCFSTPITFVGDGAITYKDQIIQKFNNCIFVPNNDLSSYNIGLAGFAHFNNNEFDDILPLYLRKPQAERMLEEKLANGK